MRWRAATAGEGGCDSPSRMVRVDAKRAKERHDADDRLQCRIPGGLLGGLGPRETPQRWGRVQGACLVFGAPPNGSALMLLSIIRPAGYSQLDRYQTPNMALSPHRVDSSASVMAQVSRLGSFTGSRAAVEIDLTPDHSSCGSN